MHAPPLPAVIDMDPPVPFTDEVIGSAAHEKHMPSVRAIAVDPERGLVLLNLFGADASVSAVIMELLRSKSTGVGFMPALFANGPITIPTQLTIQHGIRYTTFRSALATPGGSISQKNWCLLISTANIAESRRRAPIIPVQLLPPPSRRPPRQRPPYRLINHPPGHPRITSLARRPPPRPIHTPCWVISARSASSRLMVGLRRYAISRSRGSSSRRCLPPAYAAGASMATSSAGSR